MRAMPEIPQLPGVTHEFVDAGGLRTHVALAGDPEAPPLLLVHGWPQHWWCWRHVIGGLAERYRVIAPDLRGHGWTEAPKAGYEKDQLTTDLLATLDALGVEKATWVGHDWGAFTGFLAALRAPERIERLVAMCVPPPFASTRSPKTMAFVLAYQGTISTPLLGSFLVRRGLVGAMISRGRAQGKYTEEEVRTYDDIFRERPHVTVGMYRTFVTREMLPLVRGKYAHARLEVPSLLLLGDRDLITESIPAGEFEGQPNLTVERIPDVGHFLPEENPEAVLARI
jgi:pimeloyl-ACP methyl ester carboxylesterase